MAEPVEEGKVEGERAGNPRHPEWEADARPARAECGDAVGAIDAVRPTHTGRPCGSSAPAGDPRVTLGPFGP
jgi:hypothetical protein